MHEVHRSALVSHNAQDMFDLIADIGSYPEFLPWCHDARVVSGPEPLDPDVPDGPQELVAKISMSQGPLKWRFTTLNRMEPPERIVMHLLEGSLSALEGCWTIEPLDDSGCKLDLSMRFAFSSSVQDLVIGRAFELTCNKLVDAFVERARKIYG